MKTIALLPRAPESESEAILRESPYATEVPVERFREMIAAGGRSRIDTNRILQFRQRALLWVTQGVMV